MENPRLLRLKEKLGNGGVALCGGVYYTDSLITEQLGVLGFDMLWIDQEHTGFSLENIRNHLQAAALTGKVSMVRVTDHDPARIKPILELGPDAVIFPMVNTAEQARAVIEACLYPPEGVRGYGPIRAQQFYQVPMDEYLRDVKDCFWRVIQIEHEEGVRNLDEILSVPGIDSVVVGPNDLAASIGLLGQNKHPQMLKLMDEIAKTCRRHNVPLGASIAYNEQNIRDWIGRGAAWFGIGMDMSYINTGAKSVIDGTKKLLREAGKEND